MSHSVTLDSLKFILGEIEQVHALCDRALVPRKADEEVLSMAERVTILEGALQTVVSLVGNVAPPPLH